MDTIPGKRIYLGRTLRKRNARVKASAGYICNHCGIVTYPENLEVDHIQPIYQGGADSNENLQVLCVDCHKDKSADEMRKARRIGVDGWPVE